MVNRGVRARLLARAAGGTAEAGPDPIGFDVDFGAQGRQRPKGAGQWSANARAAAGGLLVAVAAVGLFAATDRAGAPDDSYAVARRALSPGTRLAPTDVALQPLDLPAPQRRRAFTDVGRLVGSTLVAPLGSGELVQASAVVTGPVAAGRRELSFPLPASGTASGLSIGERVDVVATYGSGGDAVTAVVVRAAGVADLQRPRSMVSDDSIVVTVGLETEADTLALAHAVQLAKLTVVRSGGEPIGSASPYRTPGASR